MNNGAYLSPYIKLNSRWIKDIIKPDSLYLIEKKVGKSIKLLGIGVNFLNTTPMAQAITSKIYKWDLRKLKMFVKVKDIANRTNFQPNIVKKSSLTSYPIEG